MDKYARNLSAYNKNRGIRKIKKKRSTFVLRFLRRYREVLEHCFHSERGTTVVDEPGTSGPQTSLVQRHKDFRLSVQQVSKLQGNRNSIVDCVGAVSSKGDRTLRDYDRS